MKLLLKNDGVNFQIAVFMYNLPKTARIVWYFSMIVQKSNTNIREEGDRQQRFQVNFLDHCEVICRVEVCFSRDLRKNVGKRKSQESVKNKNVIGELNKTSLLA